jgi:hypothetical protein
VTFTSTYTQVVGTDPTPTGTVTFYDNGTQIGAVQTLVNGAASVRTAALALGSHTITAVYSGDANYQGSTTTLTPAQVVNVVTTTTLTTSAGTVIFGTGTTFTATVTGSTGTPTGSVTFVDATTGAVLGTVGLSGGVAQLTAVVPAGTHTIQAIYSGDTSFRSSSATTTQVVERVPLVAVGSAPGTVAMVSVYNPLTGAFLGQAPVFGNYTGGLAVAVGDMNGDGFDDIVVMGTSGSQNGHVMIFSGRDFSMLANYFVAPGFPIPLNLAVGYVTSSSHADVIVATATTVNFVAVLDGTSQNIVARFAALPATPNTGLTVTAGAVQGNGLDQIIVGTASQTAMAGVYDASGNLINTFGVNGFNGVSVAAGDLSGTGTTNIILGTLTGQPLVGVFSNTGAFEGGFNAFPGMPFGVRVSTVDLSGTGRAAIVTSFNGPTPLVVYYDGVSFSVLGGFFTPGAVSNNGLEIGGGL